MSEGRTTADHSGLSEELLALLVCPVDHAKLDLDGQALVCQICGRRFPIEDGIPNMLVDA